MNLKFRKMSLVDLNKIKSELLTKFDDFWTYNMLQKELEYEQSYFLVAILKNEIVAFAGIRITLNEADLMNVVVKNDYRNQGIATDLLKELFKICIDLSINRLILEVNEENTNAITLYSSLGFEVVCVRKNYYGNKNAIIMEKHMEKEK